MYVIGDTPHDIHCAQVIGARSIAVASGTYSLDALLAHKPWWAVPCLPDLQSLLARLDEPAE
jgi:phosphoglycolate phosphatase-like HAD superfamily hydrolase